MSTHFAELHRVLDLLHFLPSVPDHHLNITLHHFYLSLNIRTGNKTKTGIKVQRLALYVIGWWHDDDEFRTSPSYPDSLAPQGQCRDSGGRSRCTAHTHTSCRSCRKAPGAFGAFYTSGSPALPQVQSACESSRWQLSGVAPGDSHNMRSDTRYRISMPWFSLLHTHHNKCIFLPLASHRSAFSLGSALTFPWRKSFHKALGGPRRLSHIWDSWWQGCCPSAMWCRGSRSCDRREWRRAQRKHPGRCNTETAPLTGERWGRPWPWKQR